MGISLSSGRRNQPTATNHHHHHHLHNPYYNQPPPSQPPHQPPYSYPTAAPTTTDPYAQYPYHYTYQQQQYPPVTTTVQSNSYYNNGWYSNTNTNGGNYVNPMMGRGGFQFYSPGGNFGNGWQHHQVRDPHGMVVPVSPQPPPYVEHQNAKVVKNDVNVHKDTIKLLVDEDFPDRHLVSFVFDAHFDGSITIYYFAKEDKENCKFTQPSLAISPVKVPFQKGTAQRFQQPSGTGIDLGFFDLEFLGKPTEDDVFPLVIFAEVHSSAQERDYNVQESSVEGSQRAQITQAVIEKKNETAGFQVKVIRQILWFDGVRYELRDLYGIGNASSEGFNDEEPGKECVICMTEPKNTAVIPCRHLCMCSDCAKELRLQTNKCPICRQSITELIEININSSNE
ncbi:putative E3 ubiquitin-protein ligase LUL4 [Silene latifolia]|uniref:putative E3 ubiquitin-protein ligase LUL4 n=1 Tax=Silene latifolia TaxID=37657 RepID=UPI003D76D206